MLLLLCHYDEFFSDFPVETVEYYTYNSRKMMSGNTSVQIDKMITRAMIQKIKFAIHPLKSYTSRRNSFSFVADKLPNDELKAYLWSTNWEFCVNWLLGRSIECRYFNRNGYREGCFIEISGVWNGKKHLKNILEFKGIFLQFCAVFLPFQIKEQKNVYYN